MLAAAKKAALKYRSMQDTKDDEGAGNGVGVEGVRDDLKGVVQNDAQDCDTAELSDSPRQSRSTKRRVKRKAVVLQLYESAYEVDNGDRTAAHMDNVDNDRGHALFTNTVVTA